MAIRKTNLIAASIVFLFGIAVIVEAMGHDMGSMLRIGPGFFPMMLGVGLLLISLAIVFDPHKPDDAGVIRISWRQMLSIAVGIAAFAFLIEPAGLMPAAAALIGCSALANPSSKLKTTILLAILLPLVLGIVFVYGLKMPISMGPW